ncbi:MAG TPA: methylated-DNA--[protein]-cysteine S-methyltransferase [Candidatus Polarisedimenticolaceae bacterium]
MNVRMHSPIGTVEIEAEAGAITAIRFVDGPPTSTEDPLLRRAVEELRQYFEGRRERFELPLAPKGTDFQRRVWRELETIPLGTTLSYGELAGRVGDPKASRAVGAANGRNPIAIVVPCHRVIGADGSLTGYAGGLARKGALLRLEGSIGPARCTVPPGPQPVRHDCIPSSHRRASSIPS